MIELLAGKLALSLAGTVAGKVVDAIFSDDGDDAAGASQGFQAELGKIRRLQGILARHDPERMPLRDLERLADGLRGAGRLTDGDYQALAGAHVGLTDPNLDLDQPRDLIEHLKQRRQLHLQQGAVDDLIMTNRAISLLEDLSELRRDLL
jgi:hypothetical protein